MDIASPRILSPPGSTTSSRRPSIESLGPPSPLPTSPLPLGRRANRSALRAFYGLATAGSPQPSPGLTPHHAISPISELDRLDFSADSYAQQLLATASLPALLRAENDLMNDIRGFDGERKALVYDNYSKLIAATETIRRLRASMEPLQPTTSTLEPAIKHIAEVSEGLVGMGADEGEQKRSGTLSQKEVVRWAAGAPDRMSSAVKEGRMEDAKKEMERLSAVLDKWKDVRGVDELRAKAEETLK